MSLKSVCLRCSGRFEVPDSGRAQQPSYCVTCVTFFRLQQQEAGKQSHKPGHYFADKANPTPGKMPQLPVTVLVRGKAQCGLCGSSEVADEYGHCAFGCGTFKRCECGAVLDFAPDRGN